MTTLSSDHSFEPFISSDLRPRVVPKLDTITPHDPNTGIDELQALALDVLGLSKAGWLAQHPEVGPDVIREQSYARNPEVTWNTLDEEAVLLNVARSQYYTLNRTATAIWELYHHDRTIEEIIDTLYQKYDIRIEELERDVLILTSQLHSEDLLKITC